MRKRERNEERERMRKGERERERERLSCKPKELCLRACRLNQNQTTVHFYAQSFAHYNFVKNIEFYYLSIINNASLIRHFENATKCSWMFKNVFCLSYIKHL